MDSASTWVDRWELPLRAAKLVGIAHSTLRSAIGRGEIRTVALAGGTVLVSLEDARDLKMRPRRVGRPQKVQQ